MLCDVKMKRCHRPSISKEERPRSAQCRMRLADFISSHLDSILLDWVDFARQQTPAASSLNATALLDHGRLILQEIAADMGRPQDDLERKSKSEGNSETASVASSVPSRSHARQREKQGFELVQMVAEYRALRATVLRRWSAHSDVLQVEDLEDVTRFNEAVDQALAESVEVFAAAVTRTRDLFLGVLSHDLRGPLSAIGASMAVATKKGFGDSRQADIIARSVAQMKGLLDDMVLLTRNQLGSGLAIVPANLELAQFVRDTLDEIQAISPGRILSLTTSGDLHGAWDRRRLHQALSNLVFNALKYGFPSSSIGVGVDGTDQDHVVLSVENTGTAIPVELLPKLFDLLVRADGDHQGEDTEVAGANLGLGLYVVREIATAHGGSVSVSSDARRTRFELMLPRYLSSMQTAAPATTTELLGH